MKSFLPAVVLWCIALSFPLSVKAFGNELQLWFYMPTNMLVEENVQKCIALLERAEKAGYTHVLIADSKFWRWDEMPERYIENVRRVREECRKRRIKCFAAACSIGYSNDLLSRNPNLAEGLPVIQAPFVVKNGTLQPDDESEVRLKNGGFEEGLPNRPHTPAGWSFSDEPGTLSFFDETVKCEGKQSLRFENLRPDEPVNARVGQKLFVQKFRYYHLSAKIKTENFDALAETNIAVIGQSVQVLNHHFPRLKRNQDWTQIDITFNTLDNEFVNIYLGTWGIRGGTIRWDDVRLEPGGWVNILRRAGTPIKIQSTDQTTVYTEGEDFEKLIDPKMGCVPYPGCYTAWHETPVVKIPPQSRLKEGQKVLADYYHLSIIYEEQVGCCFAEPEVAEILRWQIEQIHKNMNPDGYFLSHDEIRQCGWDKSCLDTGKTPAEMLTDNVALCVNLIKKEDPGKPIAVWSDMFDPVHNASKSGHYYLVKGQGPWFGSWEKLPKDVIVGNWNSNPAIRKKSMKHFDDRGNPQFLAGYYDSEPVEEPIRRWLQDAEPFDRVCGAMYTTWQNRYDFLEAFAAEVHKVWRERRSAPQ